MSDDIALYGLKNCDSCRKALKVLKNAVLIDIRRDVDLSSKVPYWLEQVGADLLVNKKSTTWRELDDSERDSPPSDLLVRFPTLIKRPVIEVQDKVYVGWSAHVQDQLAR